MPDKTPPPKDMNRGLTHLHSVQPAELSLVGDAANKRKWLFRKNKKGTGTMGAELVVKGGPGSAVVKMKELVAKTDPKLMSDVDSYLTSQPGQLGNEALAGGKALVRILSPLKGKLPPELAHRLVDMAAGVEAVKKDGDTPDAPGNITGGAVNMSKRHEIDEDDDGDEEVEGIAKSALSSASKAANAAFYEHLSKMGYSGRPKTHVSMNLGGETVRKSKGEQVADKTAADGNPDLSGATPEVRARIEGVLKAQEELVAKNAQLTTQNAELAKRLDTMEASNRRQELVTMAKGWGNLGIPQEDIVAQLIDADKAGKESLERVQKNFDALNAQAGQANLFTERGSPLSRAGAGGAGGADPYARIEAAAEGWVAKSGKSLTKEQATEAFLQTPDGQRMYAEYKNARPEGA